MKILLAVIILLALLRVYFMLLEQKELYHPVREIPETPAGIGILYEDVNFKMADGETLNGWYVPSNGAKVTIFWTFPKK